MTNTNRNQTLDAVKGVAIFLVMLGHVLNLNHMEDAYLYDGIKAVQMPLFMMVSGWLCGAGRKVSGLGDYGRILGKRAVSYLTPFFVWIAVLYPLELPGAFVDTLFHLDYGLWFLMTLFLLTAMVYTAQLAGSLVKGSPVAQEAVFWGIYGLLAAIVALETLLGWRFLSPELTRLYIPFYMAGYVVAAYPVREFVAACLLSGRRNRRSGQEKESLEKGHLDFVEAALAVAAAAVFFYLVIRYDLLDMSAFQALLRQITASFCGCYVIFFLCRLWPEGKAKRAAAWLGAYTLEIYVLHFHFATLLDRGTTYELYSLQGVLFVAASFVVMSAVTGAIIFVTKRIRILDFLLYGKRSGNRKSHKSGGTMHAV